MTVTSPGFDPLAILPPEVVLRVLHFTPTSALASLTAVSRAWHEFIDVTHQEVIYGSESRTSQPLGGAHDLEFLGDVASFSKYFENIKSWKGLCRRQTLLARNWAAPRPVVRESVLQIGNNPIWRFRADFKRRFFVSTSHSGGLNVTDMDTGRILWRLPSTLDRDEDAVRPYAHLEYQDGTAVFDREGDAIEVWQTGLEGSTRGEFRRIAILNHDCHTRGFQLSHSTLCVVSNEGQGFVYDMTQRPPRLTTRLSIAGGAVGHLDQDADVVIYSLGTQGYHVYEKASGACLGVLHPSHCTDKYHIISPPTTSTSASAGLAGAFARHGPMNGFSPPGPPRKDCLVPIKLDRGPLPPPHDPEHVRHGEDEWGAGMLHGNLFVGFSRAGRVFVCSNWRMAIGDQMSLVKHSSLIECESDGASFDLGGWLSVRHHHLMFEIQDRVHVVGLDDNDRIQDVDCPARASYSLLTSSAPQLTVPVSFMAMCDDAIMTTFTTLGWRQSLSDIPGDAPPPRHDNPARIFPTKTIRILTLAPDLDGSNHVPAASEEPPEPNADQPPAEEIWRSHAPLLQLFSMLEQEFAGEGAIEEDVGIAVDGLTDDDNNVDDWEEEDEEPGHGGA